MYDINIEKTERTLPVAMIATLEAVLGVAVLALFFFIKTDTSKLVRYWVYAIGVAFLSTSLLTAVVASRAQLNAVMRRPLWATRVISIVPVVSAIAVVTTVFWKPLANRLFRDNVSELRAGPSPTSDLAPEVLGRKVSLATCSVWAHSLDHCQVACRKRYLVSGDEIAEFRNLAALLEEKCYDDCDLKWGEAVRTCKSVFGDNLTK